MTSTTAIDLSSLTSDGDTLDISEGRTLRLKVWSDDQDPFREYEVYGRLAWADRNSNPEGHRPDIFDGNAEKIRHDAWWQPPTDGPRRGTPEFDQFRALVRDLIEYGMHGVTLEVLQGEDAYYRPIVVEVASLGGIDSLENNYLAEVVKELADELGIDV